MTFYKTMFIVYLVYKSDSVDLIMCFLLLEIFSYSNCNMSANQFRICLFVLSFVRMLCHLYIVFVCVCVNSYSICFCNPDLKLRIYLDHKT